jgi:hypothetical protein
MDGHNPYDQYEPNEPNTTEPSNERHGRRASIYARPQVETPPEAAYTEAAPGWTGDTWSSPVLPNRAYAQRTWDEEEYPASEPANEATHALPNVRTADTTSPAPRASKTDNPYIRPTQVESAYPSRQAAESSGAEGGRISALYFDADADTSPHTARPLEEANASANPYARPAAPMPHESEEKGERYSPPLRFVLPEEAYVQPIPLEHSSKQPSPGVYRQRNPNATQEIPIEPELRHHAEHPYRVEADAARQKPRHTLRRWLIALLILAVLAGVVYVERVWLMQQLGNLRHTTLRRCYNPANAPKKAFQPSRGRSTLSPTP